METGTEITETGDVPMPGHDKGNGNARQLEGSSRRRTDAISKETARHKFQPLSYVKEILEKEHVIFPNGELLRYSGGYYRPWPERDLNKHIVELLGEGARVRDRNEIAELLRDQCYLNPDLANNTEYMNLSNGVLDLENGSFFEHSPDLVFTHMSEFRYDPDADCPLWHKTLDRILPDPAVQKLLQQIFGYVLLADTSLHKAFIFYGDGCNGKSVVTDVMQYLVGPTRCASLQLSQMSDRFKVAELQNRLVNFAHEADAKVRVHDAVLKCLISGDLITAERKYGDPFQFRSYARIVLSTNHLPSTKDTSYGFFRRWIVLPFDETLQPNEIDEHRAEKICTHEASGVLNWAWEGLQLLRESGGFTIPPQCLDALKSYRYDVDHVLAYVDERIKVDSDSNDGTLLSVINADYLRWCERNACKNFGSRTFYDDLAKKTGTVNKKKTGGNILRGVFLNTNNDGRTEI